MSGKLLQVDGLQVRFGSAKRPLRAVDSLSFDLQHGESLGLVGESGCGKSTTARAIVGLAKIHAGSITLEGRSVTTAKERARERMPQRVQMVFQDPYGSLNPRMTAFDLVTEPLRIAAKLAKHERRIEATRLMLQVGLDPRFLNRYPHEFSGGQRQRIGIARALALDPKLVLLDEPVSALDVSIQAQVLNLLARLREERGLSYLFIAHDLAVVRHLCDRVAVMYLGRIVEVGAKRAVFAAPRHPYTRALLSAVPIPDPRQARAQRRVLLSGDPPSPDREPIGCAFATRCPKVQERCRREQPSLDGDASATATGSHAVSCFYPD